MRSRLAGRFQAEAPKRRCARPDFCKKSVKSLSADAKRPTDMTEELLWVALHDLLDEDELSWELMGNSFSQRKFVFVLVD